VPQLNSNVELLIYDGNSTDNTSEVISNYLKKSENIKYIKGDLKGGVDQDYSKCVDFAKGEMIFLFTDDDLLLPNTINYILSICKKNVSLIILNSEVKNKYLTKILKKSLLSITNDTILNNNDLNSLYKLTIPYISFIGCVIIKKSEWQSRNPHKYFGSEFVHVGVIFEKFFELKIYVSSRISITIRLGNEQWSARAFEIWIFKWQSLISSFNLISI
jgi:glycosyltransferase involved in cell wall biosynthesis